MLLFNDIINIIQIYDPNDIKVDENSFKNIFIY